MSDPELTAIRERDAQWIYNGHAGTAEHDRRFLLQMVDDLMEGVEAIARDIKLIRQVHSERYVAKESPEQTSGSIEP